VHLDPRTPKKLIRWWSTLAKEVLDVISSDDVFLAFFVNHLTYLKREHIDLCLAAVKHDFERIEYTM